MESNRFERQAELVPQPQLAELGIDVIGVGAIGRQVALQLAAIGARQVRLIDFDTVEPPNLTTQGYRQQDLGQEKVVATAQAMRELDPEVRVTAVVDRWRFARHPVVFCCVDKIAARAAIWQGQTADLRFWCDGRMNGESIRILTVDPDLPGDREYFTSTLFPEAEAHQGRCTARGTIYTASIAAGLMLHQFCRWLRQSSPPDRDLSLGLNLSLLDVQDGARAAEALA